MVVGDGAGCVARLGIEARCDRCLQRNHERPAAAEEEIRGDESVINVYYATRSNSVPLPTNSLLVTERFSLSCLMLPYKNSQRSNDRSIDRWLIRRVRSSKSFLGLFASYTSSTSTCTNHIPLIISY